MNNKTESKNCAGEQLYRKVLAGFTLKGSSFSRYCQDNDINRANARSAIMGVWNGDKGKALAKQIIKAAGVETNAA